MNRIVFAVLVVVGCVLLTAPSALGEIVGNSIEPNAVQVGGGAGNTGTDLDQDGNIDADGDITANAVTTLTVPLSAANGGTGASSYTVGDTLYADTSSTLAALADVATGNALISGGVGAAPSWGKVGLATHVSGALPAANGGTGASSYTVGDTLYADTSSTLAALADVATGNALISGGVGAAPSWGKVGLTTHVSGTLPTANGGTGISGGTVGDFLMYGPSNMWMRFPDQTTDSVLRTTIAGSPAWGKVGLATHVSGALPAANGGTGASSYTVGDTLYADTSSTLAALADVATGNALISGGVGAAPSWGKVGLATHVSGELPDANVSDTLTIGSGSTMTAPPAIGGGTPNAGAFTTLGASGAGTFGGNLAVNATSITLTDTTDANIPLVSIVADGSKSMSLAVGGSASAVLQYRGHAFIESVASGLFLTVVDQGGSTFDDIVLGHREGSTFTPLITMDGATGDFSSVGHGAFAGNLSIGGTDSGDFGTPSNPDQFSFLSTTTSSLEGSLTVTLDLAVEGNDIDVGDGGGFSGLKFDPASTYLEFWIDGVMVAHVGADGAYSDDV